MGYNADKGKQMERPEAGIVSTGVIIDIFDTTTRDVFGDKTKYADSAAIVATIEINHNGIILSIKETFPYKEDEKGDIIYNTNSKKEKLGKFVKYYKQLPKVGMMVKCITNADGYFRLLTA